MILRSVYKIVMDKVMSSNLGLVHFDLFNNQFEYSDNEIEFGYPCVFFEFQNLLPQSTGQGRQQMDCVFTLYVGSEVLGETAKDVPLQEWNSALAHLDLLDNLNEVLTAFNGQLNNVQLGSLQRTSIEPDHNHDTHIRVHKMHFMGRVVCDSAKKQYVKTNPNLKINI